MSPAAAPARADEAATPAVAARTAVHQLLNRYGGVIERLLERTDTSAATFTAWIGNAYRSTPDLWKCDPETVLGAALRCAQYGLAPNTDRNLAFIIPYGRTATFQVGYGGVLELVRRAIPGALFDGAAVLPGDEFDIDQGNADKPLTHRKAYARADSTGRRRARTSREAFAWWVRVRYPDGRQQVHSLDRAEVEYHRSFSKQRDGSTWTKSYDAMALKSVVLDMKRWLPHSPALSAALDAEGSVTDVRDVDETSGELPAPPPRQVDPDDEADAEWVEAATEEAPE